MNFKQMAKMRMGSKGRLMSVSLTPAHKKVQKCRNRMQQLCAHGRVLVCSIRIFADYETAGRNLKAISQHHKDKCEK